MEAKEKAKELIDKYIKLYPSYIVMWPGDIDTATQNIKQCALISVDEIIKSKELNYLFSKNLIDSFEFTSDDFYIYEEFIKYWKQVKKEIKKL